MPNHNPGQTPLHTIRTLMMLKVLHAVQKLLALIHIRPYRFFYEIPKRLSKAETKKRDNIDLILAERNRGWILGRICKEIESNMTQPSRILQCCEAAPGQLIFFSHYSLLLKALKTQPHVWSCKKVVFLTHVDPKAKVDAELFYVFRSHTDHIICMNQATRESLIAEGIRDSKISVIIGGYDPTVFTPVKREPGASKNLKVLISAAYYPRKNPARLLSVVRACPEFTFHLVGQGWEHCPQYEELRATNHLTFIKCSYQEYAEHYRQCQIFLSLSTLEGGPIPLLETMAMGLVPVVSQTGFAPDIVKPGYNGYIVKFEDDTATIKRYIEQAASIETQVVSDAVADYTWENFALRCSDVFEKLSVEEI